ncbi:hypothetical protein COZ61_00905 [Candidatus Berkelbacteria bacterium CG_4_8_14_3_um_filter_33_6]|uniref:Uncharacterized protein n=1 Tax=Candidatus Berkelbacteria bacterium CG_4_10_14_0_2_um_filter_35_9_33_12 TaxID=1974499 RepID=A0A2M7W3E9_9BACT|nr:MAG: hypothetical protein COX10_00630 [Candidatus Berkelbacteria bacterium CG23_combo_of_CG06-09_8_20_14_all_33_15]PIX31223.1 MAG: hypothetical protein COZ61_00905 [Candidatus Berkelbacteria bacterium CG_4_8_14_3_um_filter_33_6]PIZ27936.1 MAG: hypothetical protein COY43_03270 [Candidatus Berkelbacteria bacterium CG_4_10_14_0_8_um_filter_35_9_33_8]PJA20017.1 MAG: hypothetical protein COX60_03055 [Candidatus Berkelbacteria bacterium CG_4_10_14_0_2_um_filter_35_9_33_12]
MRIDTSTNPPGQIYRMQEDRSSLLHKLDQLLHPNGKDCDNPDKSVIAAFQECYASYATGKIVLYHHLDRNLIAMVCHCNCILRPCEDFFRLNPHCYKPETFDPNATTVIDIHLP